ncbi:MAG: hypothetical protein IJ168_06655 [Eubacterium sp.]|nr:hypothetical protein [Eubacterium sp.]
MNEQEVIKARMTDLADRAYSRGYTVFSDFLNMNEISILKSMRLSCGYTLYGGYEGAERCMAAFGDPPEFSAFPIVCVSLKPLQQMFADALTHRDVLGALMNSGINRNTLGDILLHENVAYVFCTESMAAYLCQTLTRVRHTTVSCTVTDGLPPLLTEKPAVTELVAASLRADAVIGAVYKLSRSEAARLFDSEKVFINAVLTHKDSTLLKEGDTVSVRGYGRFIFEGAVRQTKKSRTVAAVRIYR